MTPLDIVNVLTAAAPIVATVASATKKSENIERKDKEEKTINVTINNNFYTNSESQAMEAASKVQEQVISSLNSSGPRYML